MDPFQKNISRCEIGKVKSERDVANEVLIIDRPRPDNIQERRRSRGRSCRSTNGPRPKLF
jgi:hypothetical protein